MKHRYLFLSATLWIVFIAASIAWNISQAAEVHQQVNLRIAQSFFELIVTVRDWNANMGGVYVPVSATTQPNPYLKVADRDLHLPNDLTLTKINPAYMTRMISELAEQGNRIRFHITSLKPINPNNAATEWERQALTIFETESLREYYRWSDQEQTFRYMAPLITKANCLPCHKEQGYKEGDIRGGISVSFKAQPVDVWPIMVSHAIIALVGLFGIIVAGNQLERTFHELELQSHIDGLTQLRNRRYFDAYLKQEFLRAKRSQSPLSVIICDVDFFKAYNDIYGHQAGDRCLKEIAATLNDAAKRSSDIVARYGGEEFILLLPNTPTTGALATAERVRTNIEALRIYHQASVVSSHVTLSLGVATYNSGDVAAEALLERADKALYHAKQAGRNRVVGADALVEVV